MQLSPVFSPTPTTPYPFSRSADTEMTEAENKSDADLALDVVVILPQPRLTAFELFRASIDASHPIHKLSKRKKIIAVHYWNYLAEVLYRKIGPNTDWREPLKNVATVQRRAMKVSKKSSFMPGQVGYFIHWRNFFLECNGEGAIAIGTYNVQARGAAKVMQVSKDILLKGKTYASLCMHIPNSIDEYQSDLENLMLILLQNTPGVIHLQHVLNNSDRIPFENSKGELKEEPSSLKILSERKIFEKYDDSLHDYLKMQPNKRIEDEGERLSLMQQFAVGLNNIHGKDIVHRDLKPANLLIKKGEEGLKGVVTDFGAAVFLDGPNLSEAARINNEQKKTEHSTTVWYVSKQYSDAFMMDKDANLEKLSIYISKKNQFLYDPEKLKAAATKASDVCSLGYIFFEMLYGAYSLPWALNYKGSNDDYDVLKKIANLPTDWFPHPVEEGVPSIQDLIRWMTRPETADRPAISEVCAYLETLQEIYHRV